MITIITMRRQFPEPTRKSRNTGRRGTFGTSGNYGASRILTAGGAQVVGLRKRSVWDGEVLGFRV